MIELAKENFSLKDTVRERGESRCTQALPKAGSVISNAICNFR